MFEYLIGQRLKFSPGNQTGPKAFLETLVSRNIRSKRHSINVAKLHIKSLGLGTLNPQPEDRTDPYPIRPNLRDRLSGSVHNLCQFGYRVRVRFLPHITRKDLLTRNRTLLPSPTRFLLLTTHRPNVEAWPMLRFFQNCDVVGLVFFSFFYPANRHKLVCMAKKHAKINGKSICYFRSSVCLDSVPIVLSIISVYTF